MYTLACGVNSCVLYVCAHLTPSHQINQQRDEAHRKERESDHQPLRGIFEHLNMIIGAVLEVTGVDVDKKVLNVRVWEEAAGQFSHGLQACC